MKPRKSTKNVYPSEFTEVALNGSSPSYNRALDLVANKVGIATNRLSGLLLHQEWCALADICNGMKFTDGGILKAALLAECDDSEKFEGKVMKWVREEGQVKMFFEKMQELNDFEILAIISAVEFFWENYSKIGINEEWYKFPYRLKFYHENGQKEGE